MEKFYHVSPSRSRLCMDCADAALKVKQGLAPEDVSLYVGIPFCPSRCAYCSFISAGADSRLMPPYVEALLREVAVAGARIRELGQRISSIYVGGGTPTTLSAEDLTRLLSAIAEAFPLKEGLECTVEAGRPDTITREKLESIRKGGGNRISVNPQSLQEEVLRAMGRAHTAQESIDAYHLAREGGFHAINMDLIASLPRDTLAGFQDTLTRVIALAPENITVHTLALKRGARLREGGGEFPSGNEVAQMLVFAENSLRGAGYVPYYLYRQKFMSGALENVGWCLPGYESEYNICMMEELHSVLSLGAGGVSKSVQYEKGSLHRQIGRASCRERVLRLV